MEWAVINYNGFLTGPQAGNADQIALQFLHHNEGLFGLSNREISNLLITMNNLDETTGVTYMKYEQVIRRCIQNDTISICHSRSV